MTVSLAKPTLIKALRALPYPVRKAAVEAITDPSMREMVKAVASRRAEFESYTTALLSGIGVDSRARRHVDDALEAHFTSTPFDRRDADLGSREVVVGAGLHAAIWCAARNRQGADRPLVLEHNRVGGVMAVSRGPSFFLNSRNRPGSTVSVPGQQGALNYMPGLPVQAAHIDGGEYPTNDVMAWAIRVGLAMYADVVQDESVRIQEVASRTVTDTYDAAQLRFRDGGFVNVERAVVATGLTDDRTIGFGEASIYGERWLRFSSFMARMDEPFPLRGMKRVAVIGTGDSGKAVVEALTGIGPTGHASVPALDFPEQIDWYGADYTTCDSFVRGNRSRYARLAALLPRDQRAPDNRGLPSRLRPWTRRVTEPMRTIDGIMLDGVPYDYVVDCTGFQASRPLSQSVSLTTWGGSTVCRARGSGIVVVGPAAAVPQSTYESEVGGQLPENTVAIWRYAGKTALATEYVEDVERAQTERRVKRETSQGEQIVNTYGTVLVDEEGTVITVGDRVLLDETDEDGDRLVAQVLFETLAYSSDRYDDYMLVERDDGQGGGGPNNEWVVGASACYVLGSNQPF